MNHSYIVRRQAVLELLKISRSNLYQKIDKGLWPAPIQLGARAVGWLSSENEQVLSAMIAGQNQEEIKHLIKTLEANRKLVRGEAV